MRTTNPSIPFSRIGVVGLGLMGGSLARGLQRLPTPPSIVAFSNDPGDTEKALDLGIIQSAEDDPETFLEELDLVVYCTPLNATLALLAEHAPFLDPNTAITDVVSLKVPVMGQAEALGLKGRFVGSHPLCGGEGSGFGASRDDLFEGSKVWIVPGEADSTSIGSVEALWESLGSKGAVIQARPHDALMAVASHLPQLTANVLALAMEESDVSREDLGPGGMDMTRLAGSSPEMWIDLFENAPTELSDALALVEGKLSEVRTLLERGEGEALRDLMNRNKEWFKGAKWK